jgi:hypothetical protein
MRRMNERLTNQNPHAEIFRWLPIGRRDPDHGFSAGEAARRDAGDKRRYRGSNGKKMEQG